VGDISHYKLVDFI